MNDEKSPHPVENAVKMLAEIHADNLRRVPRSQRGIEWLTDTIGRPWFAYSLVAFVLLWSGVDIVAGRLHRPFDTGAFSWLQLIVGTFSLMMAALILISENRQGRLADQRAQVTLQLALVIDRKAAKIVELLETLRKDDPTLPDRNDSEAEQMAEATDLRTAVDRLETETARAVEKSSPG
ncbi:MAG TPA: DUF1003 domain-containing protein [Candidatus Tumulicola sp.]|jgi:uncharacterized membrane protein